MNKEETQERLEEAINLMCTHLEDSHLVWEVKEKITSSREKYLVLIFEVEYSEEEE